MTDSGFISDYCRHHRGELLAYVSSRLHDVCLAEDIVQDVFLRLLTATQVISPAAIHGLALTMARHLMADHFRRQARHEHFEHFIVYSQPGSGEPESVVSAALLTEQLEHQLARHDDESARIYRLHLYDGMGNPTKRTHYVALARKAFNKMPAEEQQQYKDYMDALDAMK